MGIRRKVKHTKQILTLYIAEGRCQNLPSDLFKR